MPGNRNTPQAHAAFQRDAAGRFAISGTVASIRPYGAGHIHATYRVRTKERSNPGYILQRVNTAIFTDVPRLMENIARVTEHMRRQVEDPRREVLTVVPSHDGRPYHQDDDGNYWRCFLFIEHKELGERPHDLKQAFEAGRLYGRFVSLLSDLPGPPLHEIIPRFHDVEFRLTEFAGALRADPLKRRQGAEREIAFVLARAEDMKRVLVAGREGRIRRRITHNDTKFNNVLFDDSGRGLCLIDLDTVMSGYAHYDFGDAVRSAANQATEDEADPGRVRVDLDVFRELARGFIQALKGGLDDAEIGLLAFAAKLLPYTIGLRFLGDHMSGDVYFKTAKPGHNLQRARAQFALLADMERHFSEMEDIISRLAAGQPRPDAEKGG